MLSSRCLSMPAALRLRHALLRRWRVAAIPRPAPQPSAAIECSLNRSHQAASEPLGEPVSLSHHRITGDGSCMFRALVQGASLAKSGSLRSEEYAAALELRQAIVAELQKNRSDIEPFLPGIADDFDEYLEQMAQPGVWGGEPELVMAANVLQRPIKVYQPTLLGPQHIITYGEDMKAHPLHLLWSGNHYDLLIPQYPSKL